MSLVTTWLKIKNNPVNISRWAQFKNNKRGYWSLWIFLWLDTLATGSFLL